MSGCLTRDYENIDHREWTEQETFLHLRGTFDLACKHHADVMEPYIAMLVETNDQDEQQRIMTQALSATQKARYAWIDGFLGK